MSADTVVGWVNQMVCAKIPLAALPRFMMLARGDLYCINAGENAGMAPIVNTARHMLKRFNHGLAKVFR